MNRPERQTKHLEEKLAAKASRTKSGVGKKAKRWKKALAGPVAPAAAPATPATPAAS